MVDWILLLFSAHGGRFENAPTSGGATRPTCFFYPISFLPKRIAKVQNHKERQARRVQNIVIAQKLPAQSVQKAFAIINSATEQDFTKV